VPTTAKTRNGRLLCDGKSKNTKGVHSRDGPTLLTREDGRDGGVGWSMYVCWYFGTGMQKTQDETHDETHDAGTSASEYILVLGSSRPTEGKRLLETHTTWILVTQRVRMVKNTICFSLPT
jgi:hypothetical protein